MSIQAVAWVLDHSQSRGLARLVLISLANHAHKDTAECYPAQRTIAAEAGISLGAVSVQIQTLIELGELSVIEAGGPRTATRYQLPLVQRSSDEHDIRSPDERSVHPRSEQNERSPDERSVQSRSARSVHSRSEQNHHLTVNGEVEASPPPATLPAKHWAEQWARIRGVTATRSVLKSWIPKVQEFLDAGGQPTEELLQAAYRAGIESPAGWGFITSQTAAQSEVERVSQWMRT